MSDYCDGNVYIPHVFSPLHTTPQAYSSATVQLALAAHIESFQAHNTCLWYCSCETDASCYWL